MKTAVSIKNTLPAEAFRHALDYDETTGLFHRRISSGNAHAGDLAGSLDTSGYWQINIFGYLYRAHRLAWIVSYGAWPPGEIDHINGCRTDNRLSNLRLVSVAGNAQNKCGVIGASGLPGARRQKQNGNWVSEIKKNRKSIHLGVFNTAEEAHAAYLQAKARLHPMANLSRLTGERRKSSEGSASAVLALATTTERAA